jgi:hypothetical protein
MTIGIKPFGDWARARQAVSVSAQRRIDLAWRKAILQEAHFWRKEIVQGLTKQAPGGKRFKPLAESTILKRKSEGFAGRKALIRTATFRRNIKVSERSNNVFIGVLRGTRTSDGKDMVNIARVHEEGRVIVIKVTPKMRKYFFAMLKRMGAVPTGGSGGFKRGILVIKIPARPFIGPIRDKMTKSRSAMIQRMAKRVSLNSKGEFGLIA